VSQDEVVRLAAEWFGDTLPADPEDR
jgi:hypothetical protein